MVFWFWVGICVLVVPVIAFGLVTAALYLCAHHAGIDLNRLSMEGEDREPPPQSMWRWF